MVSLAPLVTAGNGGPFVVRPEFAVMASDGATLGNSGIHGKKSSRYPRTFRHRGGAVAVLARFKALVARAVAAEAAAKIGGGR